MTDPPSTQPKTQRSLYNAVLQRRGVLQLQMAVLFTVASMIVSGCASSLLGPRTSDVILEPVASEGAFPWTESVDTYPDDLPRGTVGNPTAAGSGVLDSPDAATADVRLAVNGDRPGIYGGTNDVATCDTEQLINYLEANPAKAAAFAGVLGIQNVRHYIEGLTPVLIAADTRVTNHDYRNGRAHPVQAVLQAGTAVLIDAHGVPRVRCACGNPLVAPQVTTSQVSYRGPVWTDFTPRRTVVVQPAVHRMERVTVKHVTTGTHIEVKVRVPVTINVTTPPTPSYCVGPDCPEPPVSRCEGPGCPAEPPVSRCEGPGCPAEPPVSRCEGPGCPAEPPVSRCEGPGCPEEPPVSRCEGPDCPEESGTGCEGPFCPEESGTGCDGPDCPQPPARRTGNGSQNPQEAEPDPPIDESVPSVEDPYVPPVEDSYVPPPVEDSYVPPPVEDSYVPPPVEDSYVPPPVEDSYVPPPVEDSYVPPPVEDSYVPPPAVDPYVPQGPIQDQDPRFDYGQEFNAPLDQW